MSDELSCKELVELVTDHFEEKLSSGDRARFVAHLETCDGCEMYLEQIRQTINALGKLPEESLPAETKEELIEAFRNWKSDS